MSISYNIHFNLQESRIQIKKTEGMFQFKNEFVPKIGNCLYKKYYLAKKTKKKGERSIW
jgi:hypothetical protein